jgi:hypothetical protein
LFHKYASKISELGLIGINPDQALKSRQSKARKHGGSSGLPNNASLNQDGGVGFSQL